MNRIAVIGGGTMGAGIAQVAATHGCDVLILEVDRAIAERAVAGIHDRIDRLIEKNKMTEAAGAAAKRHVHAASDPRDLAGSTCVIEAIVEDLDLKVRVLAPLRDILFPDAILASNTSSLSITRIGQAVGAPQRVCGMHFFNPAPVMPLVEIIAGRDTDPATIQRATDLAQSWGKTTVRVKDTPGFIVNRVARPYYLEALRLLEECKASCDGIDLIMTEVGGFRMGPFELMDLVGIDVNYAVSQSVYEQLGRPARLRPSDIQARLVQQNKLGRKTGIGFYSYQRNKPEVSYRLDAEPIILEPAVRRAWDGLRRPGGWDIPAESGYVVMRILAALMNEAARAAEEEVASEADIDTAMKLGTNYPKGLLAWAAELGHARVGDALRALDATEGHGRFAPARRFA